MKIAKTNFISSTISMQSSNHDIFCVGVMFSGEYDVCEFTLSVYPHRARSTVKIGLATVRIEPPTFGILTQCSANLAKRSGRFEYVIFRN